jgi:hypothetical protein
MRQQVDGLMRDGGFQGPDPIAEMERKADLLR